MPLTRRSVGPVGIQLSGHMRFRLEPQLWAVQLPAAAWQGQLGKIENALSNGIALACRKG